jgi:predicted GH43/DUF377 family glycosyl hydrolase
MALAVKRQSMKFMPDPKRVIARFFMPGQEDRAESIIQRILSLTDSRIHLQLNEVLRNFSKRHRNISKIFENNYNLVEQIVKRVSVESKTITHEKKLLIGSYFTQEYSIEAAAFFNPSIVEDPYQGSLNNGQVRVIASFRATGEGHISSIVFRSGILDKNNKITFAPIGTFVDVPEVVKRHVYRKAVFLRKLEEMRIIKDVVGMVMDRLGDTFVYGELLASIEETRRSTDVTPSKEKVIQAINWLASSHYEITFSLDTAISERVIFPVSYSESNGIEDARFVKFIDDDGAVTYYATYTAYNGFTILPKLMETEDFYNFKIMPLHGSCAQNKGLALFPRRIGGKYAMISRCDGENVFIMYSDNINVWPEAVKIREPSLPDEFVKIGTGGSPIETEKGWLLITHGVGPVRTYTLGAILLDLENPARVIAYLDTPLLSPEEGEREGYVPNVVYSCGSIVHNGELIIPYGMSDYCSSFATIPLDELLGEMKKVR